MSCDGCVALPRGAMGLSAVCYCDISYLKKLNGDYRYFNLILRTWGGGQKICKMLKTFM